MITAAIIMLVNSPLNSILTRHVSGSYTSFHSVLLHVHVIQPNAFLDYCLSIASDGMPLYYRFVHLKFLYVRFCFVTCYVLCLTETTSVYQIWSLYPFSTPKSIRIHMSALAVQSGKL